MKINIASAGPRNVGWTFNQPTSEVEVVDLADEDDSKDQSSSLVKPKFMETELDSVPPPNVKLKAVQQSSPSNQRDVSSLPAVSPKKQNGVPSLPVVSPKTQSFIQLDIPAEQPSSLPKFHSFSLKKDPVSNSPSTPEKSKDLISNAKKYLSKGSSPSNLNKREKLQEKEIEVEIISTHPIVVGDIPTPIVVGDIPTPLVVSDIPTPPLVVSDIPTPLEVGDIPSPVDVANIPTPPPTCDTNSQHLNEANGAAPKEVRKGIDKIFLWCTTH